MEDLCEHDHVAIFDRQKLRQRFGARRPAPASGVGFRARSSLSRPAMRTRWPRFRAGPGCQVSRGGEDGHASFGFGDDDVDESRHHCVSGARMGAVPNGGARLRSTRE